MVWIFKKIIFQAYFQLVHLINFLKQLPKCQKLVNLSYSKNYNPNSLPIKFIKKYFLPFTFLKYMAYLHSSYTRILFYISFYYLKQFFMWDLKYFFNVWNPIRLCPVFVLGIAESDYWHVCWFCHWFYGVTGVCELTWLSSRNFNWCLKLNPSNKNLKFQIFSPPSRLFSPITSNLAPKQKSKKGQLPSRWRNFFPIDTF